MKKGCIKKGCIGLLAAITIIVLSVIGIVYSSKPKWQEEYGRRFMDVAYGSYPYNTYDLYLPNYSNDGAPLSLILYVHGGSWLGGDKDEHTTDCHKWVQKGYVTATMNYSLLGTGDASITGMLEEIDACIRHIVGHARQNGITVNQMALSGTSAGGHLCMMYAYGRRHALPLKFVAVKVGPSDLRILFPYNPNAKEKDLQDFAHSCTGKIMDPKSLTPERLDSIKLSVSPIHHINDTNAIPAIWAYGAKDRLVTPEHYKSLKERYDENGGSYSLIVFPNSGHLLMKDKECMERYESTMYTYCRDYFGY